MKSTRALRTGALVITVCTAYYAGSWLGLQLRLLPLTPSVLWPPNAILTAVLLLNPPRRWLVCVLAAFPAHVAVQWQTDWTVALILSLFFTNALEAVLAAAGLRQLSDAPHRLDAPRRLAAFLFAVVVAAPVVATFADAAAVAWLRHDPYWAVWRNRLAGSLLGQLTVVPVILGVVAALPSIRRASPYRLVEAAAVGGGLFLVGLLGVTHSFEVPQAVRAVWMQMPLALNLPLLLWAAMRFGPGGAGVALLMTSVLAARNVVEGLGPLALVSPAVTPLALTLSLVVVSVTVLWVSALVAERRRTHQLLDARLRAEQLLSALSAALVAVPGSQIVGALEQWLAHIGAFLRVDCVRLFELGAGSDLITAHLWRSPGFVSMPVSVRDDFPWCSRRLLDRTPVVLPSIDALPHDAAIDRASMRRHGYGSMLVLPMVAGGRPIGALAFGAGVPGPWPAEQVTWLRLVAEVLSNAVARHQTDEALRASEALKATILQELAHVSRIATVGEMTATLAHQLNQPLAAILTNAQAALHLLQRDGVSAIELRAILDDIVSDDRRASEVILRLRELLRKREDDMTTVDLTPAVTEIAELVRTNAATHGVALTVDIAREPILVRGDRVQLQQVVLNLLQNAIEATSERLPGERTVLLRLQRENGSAHLTVQDSGAGLGTAGELVFEPFYSTKAGNIGMGLSIARTILETHGGVIRARNTAPGGAVFEVTLALGTDAEH